VVKRNNSRIWGSTRFFALLIVLALHVTLIYILMTSRIPVGEGMRENRLDLVYMPPITKPKSRSDVFDRPRIKTDISLAKPEIVIPMAPEDRSSMTPSSTAAGSSFTSGSGGANVNWSDEAKRAIRAYEIRGEQSRELSHSVMSPWDNWFSLAHRAGDRYKTESGDWIVWISADCYQIAVGHSTTVVNARATQTVCPMKRGPGRE
jgi:hypothetical protein